MFSVQPPMSESLNVIVRYRGPGVATAVVTAAIIRAVVFHWDRNKDRGSSCKPMMSLPRGLAGLLAGASCHGLLLLCSAVTAAAGTLGLAL